MDDEMSPGSCRQTHYYYMDASVHSPGSGISSTSLDAFSVECIHCLDR
jgi:hypothetical protein